MPCNNIELFLHGSNADCECVEVAQVSDIYTRVPLEVPLKRVLVINNVIQLFCPTVTGVGAQLEKGIVDSGDMPRVAVPPHSDSGCPAARLGALHCGAPNSSQDIQKWQKLPSHC